METTNYEEFFPNCNVEYVKDKKHWHQLRGKGIGGSDAGVVMNVSNYKTPYELWEEKTGAKKPVFQTSEAIEKGNALEPILIELFGVLYKNKFDLIDTKDISLSNKKYPFLRANLDGAMIDCNQRKMGIGNQINNYSKWCNVKRMGQWSHSNMLLLPSFALHDHNRS